MANIAKLFSRSMAVSLLKQMGIPTNRCLHASVQIEADEIPRLVATFSVDPDELAKALVIDEAKDAETKV